MRHCDGPILADLMNQGTLTPRTSSENRSGLSPVAEMLRRHDRDRFQTALFAPSARREGLFALYAFNYEIARVREIVREPMLGRIRLQWWREIVAVAYEGGVSRRHDVAEALTATIRASALTRAHFERMIDAREAALDPAPLPDIAALEAHCADNSAALVHLAGEWLGLAGAVAAPREAGIAYGLAGLLRSMPYLAGESRPIPDDIAAEAGLGPADYRSGNATPAMRRAVAALAAAAERHLAAARLAPAVPRAALAAVLPAVVARRFLRRLRNAGFDPFAADLAVPDPLQIWRLTAAWLRGRV
jgi:NADH dehydrogenase [ubiquinone] 1 alpha subcomplex assembly factor 6